MASVYESELESELEQELQEVHELHEGHTEGGFGEAGMEGEGILGTIGNVLGGLLGEGESELETESELHEMELEAEFESGEHFFKNAFKGIGSFIKRAAPILKSVAKVAAPMVGTAIGGPFGAVLGQLASSALGEQEMEAEMELHELELEMEGSGEMESPELETEHEAEHEVLHEIVNHELTEHEAIAEMMAEAASHEQHEGHAEAMAGAAAITVISPADRRALRDLLPHITKGVAILTRILRRRRITRPAVRAVPTIVRQTVRSLKRQAAAGKPITRRLAGRTAAAQVRSVLGRPRVCAAAIARNMKSSRTIRRRPARRAVRG